MILVFSIENISVEYHKMEQCLFSTCIDTVEYGGRSGSFGNMNNRFGNRRKNIDSSSSNQKKKASIYHNDIPKVLRKEDLNESIICVR